MALEEKKRPLRAFGWAARDTSGEFSPFNFTRRNPKKRDVVIKILYCGVCHSDLHISRSEWALTHNMPTYYPIVTGHEIVGIVMAVGFKVEKFKPGDRVGLGVLSGSCRSCADCKSDQENYCKKAVFTDNSVDYENGNTITQGGFSNITVIHERYVLCFPDSLPLDAGAPLLCAGITSYSPIMYHGLYKPGTRLGIVGLGGLGHMAVKFAKAFGINVTVISASLHKKEDAICHLGADSFVLSTDKKQMEEKKGTLDAIIDTGPGKHDMNAMLDLLNTHGKLILVGLPPKPLEMSPFSLVHGRKTIIGSAIGGMMETQEMLEFAALHDITCDVEVIPMDQVNKAMNRLAEGDVRYRFVIDIGNTLYGDG